ncbi:MAG: universal stress protein [Syntrophobacteraceae bacterium]|jgi:nucleotide-binding universal stress UspA family protein
MERFLIALDCQPDCVKILDYMVRVLKGIQDFEFTIFHVFATESPDKLRMEAVQRIEHMHAARPDLAGYFWKQEDEKNMERCFIQAREKLVLAGFRPESVLSLFAVQSGDIAEIILAKAAELGCSTIVLGRRRPSLVKQLLLGSVSTSVVKLAHSSAVWVVEI